MYRDRKLLAGFLNIFYEFDPSTLIWTDLSENCAGDPVPAREKMGFTSMNERLVIFGGSNSTSKCMSFIDTIKNTRTDKILLNHGLNLFDC